VARSPPSWGSVPKMRRVRYSTPADRSIDWSASVCSQLRHGRPQVYRINGGSDPVVDHLVANTAWDHVVNTFRASFHVVEPRALPTLRLPLDWAMTMASPKYVAARHSRARLDPASFVCVTATGLMITIHSSATRPRRRPSASQIL
jgi:hypothetical protein